VPGLRSDFLADKRDVYDLLLAQTSDIQEVFHLNGTLPRARAAGSSASERSAGFGVRRHGICLLVRLWGSTGWGRTQQRSCGFPGAIQGIDRWDLSADDLRNLAELPSILQDPKRMDWRAAASTATARFVAALPGLEQERGTPADSDSGRCGGADSVEALPLAGQG